MNNNKKIAVTMNSMKVEAIKPINEPEAALRALRESLLLRISPRYAPTKGVIRIANGMGINIPATKPMVAPIIPYLLPPK